MMVDEDRMKIAVAGLGYVGLSNAILLAQENEVVAFDINEDRVDAVNARRPYFNDKRLANFLSTRDLNLSATTEPFQAFVGADYVLISTPTNFDVADNSFDTSTVENVINTVISINPQAFIIVKSTVPIGFIDAMRSKFDSQNIAFSPEFLREGSALDDNLHPSRIIIGDQSEKAKLFAHILLEGSEASDTPILYMGTREAEATKLFANTYLAMRVAFFNELDSYALLNNLEAREIIEGVCHDPRIGMQYNNPSFGYGGYCLPKDTKQLLSNFSNVPQDLIKAIVDSNDTRKDLMVHQILKKDPKVVGVYRLVMKTGSDNFRESSILGLIERLIEKQIKIILYEPDLNDLPFPEIQLYSDLTEFKHVADLIIANRSSSELSDTEEKLFSRDLFGKD